MGSKRLGLARTQALIENLKRELAMGEASLTGLAFLAGKVPDTVSAASSAAALSEGTFIRVDSTNNAHKVKMFEATKAGQLAFITNVDNSEDAVVRNGADNATLVTLGEGLGALLISTAAGDNWVLAIKGS